MTIPHQADFVRVVTTLRPYLDQLVVVGAWCHRLLRFHARATAPGFPPLMTEDADVATPERLRPSARSLDALLVDGGFTPRLSGEGPRPISRYVPVDDPTGLYVEFIAPLRGSGYNRKGELDDILAVAGISAQKLRYVELLLFEPWTLRLTGQIGFPVVGEELPILVANPASYLAQKVLSLHRRRSGPKRPKDALYIHDTLMMFGAELGTLRDDAARVLQLLPPATRREFQVLRTSLFQNSALLVEAAMIAKATGRANPPTSERLAIVCTTGLAQVFAP